MTELINNEKNMYCLDGDVIEIEGVKFGEAMGSRVLGKHMY